MRATRQPGPVTEDHRPARQRFRLDVEPPTRRGASLRAAILLVLGALNLAAGPTNPGGRRARIVDIESGAVLGVLTERFGDAPGGSIAEAQEDLAHLDAAAFAARWVPAWRRARQGGSRSGRSNHSRC